MQEVVSGATGGDFRPEAFIDRNTICERLAGAQVCRHGGHAQHKLAMLVQHVEAVVTRGPRVAEAVMDAIVEFSLKKFNYWLKVAADLKGTLIDSVLDHAKEPGHRVRLELGAFVGYSSIRLSGGKRGPPLLLGAEWRSLSLEVDPLHVCVARHLLNLAERSAVAEVVTGQARDSLPRLMGELGEGALGFAFMDHRGTRFQSELRILERQRLASPDMDLICDNVLHPGAPIYIWQETRPTPDRVATLWSLPEFGGESCIEDWMAHSRYAPKRAVGE